MDWTAEAEAAMKKVPFFVRKRVRARVENEAAQEGKTRITLAEINATQKRYLSGGMAKEVRGYRIETCFGPNGCPNRAVFGDGLQKKLEQLLANSDLLGFLKSHVGDNLKFHHEFRVSLADCPNACSQPQIKDVGILGATMPGGTDQPCSGCGQCEDVCRENAVAAGTESGCPEVDGNRCLACGLCIPVCPTGSLAIGQQGFRVQLGGKLGRHPRLARELPGIFREDQIVEIVAECLRLYKKRSKNGRRFAELFTDEDYQDFARRWGNEDGSVCNGR